MRRPVAFHPLLVAVFPALSLWARNVDEVPFSAAWGPLAVSLGATAAALAAGTLWLRDHRRAAVAASGLAFLALTYGHAWRLVHPLVAAHGVLLAVWIGLAVLVVRMALRVVRVGETTRALNSLGVALVSVALVPVGFHLADEQRAGLGTRPAAHAAVTDRLDGDKRDIYYIVLDRYGRADSLERLFGYDNGAFTSWLEQAGFELPRASTSNYPKTAHSLAASLNMGYVQELLPELPRSGDWRHVYGLLDAHEIGRLLTANGYRYLHYGTWWEPTGTSRYAHRTFRAGSVSEFTEVFLQGTVARAARELRGAGDRAANRAATLYQFRELRELAARPRDDVPTFVFAHLTIPHEPYVFAADCTTVTAEQEAARPRSENYVGQVECANRQMRAILTRLLDGPEETDPIVVLQADEGPHPVRYDRAQRSFVWPQATEAELEEKFHILNAYYLPGLDRSPVYPTITPVNTFRMILDAYHGTDLGLLPDRAYVFEDASDLYTFTDVTDLVGPPYARPSALSRR